MTPAFPTVIGQLHVPDAEVMNRDLQALILAEESEYSSLGRSNIGGWHSRPDFLNRPDPAVASFNNVAYMGAAPNDRCHRWSE